MRVLVAVILYGAIGLGFSSCAENVRAADGGTMPARIADSGVIIQSNAGKTGSRATDASSPFVVKHDGTSGPAGTVSTTTLNAMRSYLGSARAYTHDTSSLNIIRHDGTSGPAGNVSESSVNALNSHLSSSSTTTDETGFLNSLNNDGTSGPAGTVSTSALNTLNSYLANRRLLISRRKPAEMASLIPGRFLEINSTASNS